MILQKRSAKIYAALSRQKERLAMPFTASPVYFFVPVGLISLLLIYVSVELNPRLFSAAKPVQIALEESPAAQLWYSLAPSEDGVRIVSSSGELFSVPTRDGEKSLKIFSLHLKERLKALVADVAVANRMNDQTALVVLSVDEHLNYAHVRPIIYALAEAGVTRYGFEGRIIKN